MVLRLESSWMNLIILVVATCWVYSWFTLLLIYIVPYFELADDIYSVRVVVLTPFFYVFLFVICVMQQTFRQLQLNSRSSQSSLSPEIQGELMRLAWTGSSSSSLDALNFRHGLAFWLFLFLDIPSLVIWDRCSCDDDFQILGNNRCWILDVNELVFI